jgi:iron complex outermembrane recepter protein
MTPKKFARPLQWTSAVVWLVPLVYTPHGLAQTTTLPTINVVAPKNNPDTSLFGAGSGFEIPLSITTLSAEQLRAQGVTSLSNVIKYDTSASDAYNTLGYVESLSLRGFLLDNRFNYRRDGLPISNHVPLAMENKQTVELLKGTSGTLAGVSAPGGLINWVVKQPTSQASTQVSAEVSERATVLLSADAGGRIAQDRFGYRVNFSAGQRRPLADNARGAKQFVSGYFDWRISPNHIVAIENETLKSKQISVPGFSLLDSNRDGVGDQVPVVPSAKLNLNSQTWALPFASQSQTGSLRYQYLGKDGLRAGARIGWQRIKTQDRIAFPDGCSTDTTYVYPGFCANGDVDIYDFRSENERRNTDSVDAYVLNRVVIGQTTHDWKVGLLSSRYREQFEPYQAYNFVGTSNIYAPRNLPSDPLAITPNTNSQIKTTQVSVSNTIKWQALSWSLGLRHTQLRSRSAPADLTGSSPTSAVAYNQSFTTPWLASSYKISDASLIYASAGKGIESEFVPNRPDLFRNYGQALPTLVSRQTEIGWRQKWSTGNLNMALFSIRKPYSGDVSLSDGVGQSLRIAGARVARHRGVELSIHQQLSERWDIDANVTAIDAVQIATADGTDMNKRTVNVAPLQVRLNTLYKLTPTLSLLNSVSYRSTKPVTRDNAVQLPAAAQWDALLSYTLSDSQTSQWTARFGINNLLNKAYWKDAPTQPWGGIYLFAAEPRAIRLLISGRY